MKSKLAFAAFAAAVVGSAGSAAADYETHPHLQPSQRCVTADGVFFEDAGVDMLHCQPLFWDIPAATKLGYKAAAAPFGTEIPFWPRGLVDRLPPLFIYDADGDGIAEDCPGDDEYYGQFDACGDGIPDGFETAGTRGDRTELCPDPDQVPWWQPIFADPDTGARWDKLTGIPFLSYGEGEYAEGGSIPQEKGHLHEISCRRGSRATIGPWQVGIDPGKFDAKARQRLTRFENSDRMDRDQAAGHLGDDNLRWEWNDGTEFYNHFAAHHGVCYDINNPCNRALTKEDIAPPSEENPEGGECWDYQKAGNTPEEKAATDPTNEDPDNGGCNAGNEFSDTCRGKGGSGAFRNATQIPGRLYVELPDGRGLPSFEDQLWGCDHHVVHQLPPGSYGLTKLADYRLQRGGITNSRETPLSGAAPGTVIGGSIGEMVIQYFTRPADDPVLPINFMFNAVADAVTTLYPPFTYNYHTSLWTPPFDAEISLFTIHSHHRMVKGTMDILPHNPPRLNSSNPLCGGSKNGPAEHMYTGWEWEDAYPCEYWKDPDGTLTIRKGEFLATSCYVNNGVTPEAIKHGLVAGSTIEALKELGAPIPEYPALVPASTWGDALAESPVGDQLLYGTHPPINYRVVYKCTSETRVNRSAGGQSVSQTLPVSGPMSAHVATIATNRQVCNPNPALDADGDYVDGPYLNEAQCGEGGYCEPSSLVFACVGEDEMCIGVAMYWAMDRLGDTDSVTPGHDQAVENLQSGDPEKIRRTGTPGSAGVKTDLSGICSECDEGAGL